MIAKKYIDTQCTSVLFSPVFAKLQPASPIRIQRSPHLPSSAFPSSFLPRVYTDSPPCLRCASVCTFKRRNVPFPDLIPPSRCLPKPFRINTHFARFWRHLSPFRINTSTNVHSKQLYLSLESTLMKKGGRGGQLLLTRNPNRIPFLRSIATKALSQYVIGPTSFCTSAISTIT